MSRGSSITPHPGLVSRLDGQVTARYKAAQTDATERLMAAFFRFLFTLVFKWDLYPTKDVLAPVTTRHRVRLRDLDLNWHMNNARYLNFLDAARLEHSIRTGIFSVFRRRGNFLVANIEISYLKSLLPFQRFTITTQVLGWDARYYYIRHQFHAEGELYATACARMVFTQDGKRADPKTILVPLAHGEPSPPLRVSIRHWQAMLAAKREESEAN